MKVFNDETILSSHPLNDLPGNESLDPSEDLAEPVENWTRPFPINDNRTSKTVVTIADRVLIVQLMQALTQGGLNLRFNSATGETVLDSDYDIECERTYGGDWQATDRNTYDGAIDGSNQIGRGKSPEAAVRDLLAQLAEIA